MDTKHNGHNSQQCHQTNETHNAPKVPPILCLIVAIDFCADIQRILSVQRHRTKVLAHTWFEVLQLEAVRSLVRIVSIHGFSLLVRVRAEETKIGLESGWYLEKESVFK